MQTGEHDLAEDPYAIVHIIPNGALEPLNWAVDRAEDISTHGLTDFNREPAANWKTPTGRRLAHNDEDEPKSYTELSKTGVVEAVSTRFVKERADATYYDGHKLEAAITALAAWADRQYADIDIEITTIHVTLQDVEGLELTIPERARTVNERVVLESDEIRPFPFRFDPMDGSENNHHQIREDLSPLFDSLWAIGGQFKSPYFGDGVNHRFIADLARKFT